jgi:hypothetical protein
MCGVGATVSSVVSMEAADIGTTNRLVETALTSEAVGRWKDAGVNNRRIAGGALVAGVLLLAALVVGGYVAHKHFVRGVNGDDFAIWDDPKRTFFLPNDTGGPRLMRRCEYVDECRSPDAGELVQPRESFDFKLYYDEDRTYIVANVQGRTLGCVTAPVANGVGPYPASLSDLTPCPRGTPKTS